MNEEFSEIFGFFLYIAGFIGWLTSVISDASHSRVAWVIVDILVFPIGIGRGIGMWFGFI